MSEYIYRSNGEPLANEHGEISLALVGAIVRCHDCKYYEPNMYRHFTCELLQFHVEPDGFCKWGERKDNGNS